MGGRLLRRHRILPSAHDPSLVLGEGLVLALIGIAVGLLVGQWVARGMGALLLDVRPSDPVAVATAGMLCLATAVLGCVRPTLTAARVDPMIAMRAE